MTVRDTSSVEWQPDRLQPSAVLGSYAALVICEKVKSIEEGIKLAENKIDSGVAQKKLKSLVG